MKNLSPNRAIEIKIGDVSLAAKLDALGACLAAVREAHRYDQLNPGCWAAMHQAQEKIAEAMLCAPHNKTSLLLTSDRETGNESPAK